MLVCLWRTPVAPRDVMWVSCWVNNKCTENMLCFYCLVKSLQTDQTWLQVLVSPPVAWQFMKNTFESFVHCCGRACCGSRDTWELLRHGSESRTTPEAIPFCTVVVTCDITYNEHSHDQYAMYTYLSLFLIATSRLCVLHALSFEPHALRSLLIQSNRWRFIEPYTPVPYGLNLPQNDIIFTAYRMDFTKIAFSKWMIRPPTHSRIVTSAVQCTMQCARFWRDADGIKQQTVLTLSPERIWYWEIGSICRSRKWV